MVDEQFRLPISGLEIIERILQAYVACGKGPVKLDDVAQRAAMARTTVSANNAFLSSVGLIEGGNLKSLTELGREVGLAASYPLSPELTTAWKKTVEASEPLQKIVDAVRIRRGMTVDSLVTHILLTAGIPKSTGAVTGARSVIDLLEAAGKVEEADGRLRATTAPDNEEPSAPFTAVVEPETKVLVARGSTERGLVLNVNINLTLGDGVSLEVLGSQLAALIKQLSGDAE